MTEHRRSGGDPVALQGIIEELFFRYLALGTLRRYLGVHGAVWVSAVMFGVGHVVTRPQFAAWIAAR